MLAFRNGAPAGAETVIALHCSGGSPRQWRALAERLEPHQLLVTPTLATRAAANWSLAEEAAPIVAQVDDADGPVHLVGHSYGAAVALEVALRRPDRLASLALYEPTIFSLLAWRGADAADDLAEIREVANDMEQACAADAFAEAAERFVVYWGGRSAWDGASDAARQALAAYAPKGCADFRSLIGAQHTPAAYRAIRADALVLAGARTVPLAGRLARQVARTLPRGRLRVVENAGHMGPLTEAGAIADWLALHIGLSRRRRASA